MSLTLYHGGNLRLNEPQKPFMGFDGKPINPRPVWLTSDIGFARLYADRRDGDIYKVVAEPRKTFPDKPLRVKEGNYIVPSLFGEQLIEDMVNDGMFGLGDGEYDEAEQILKAIDNLNYDAIETGSFVSWLKKNGYDSVWVRGDGPKNLMILDPSIITVLPNSLNEIYVSEQDANPDDVFGQWLWPDIRSNVPPEAKQEPDTPEEKSFKLTVKDHYNGDMDNLARYIPTMVDLETKGKYTDILSVPANYKFAYRVMGLSRTQLESILGAALTDDNIQFGTAEKAIAPQPPTREHASWTVDPTMFKQMAKDWGKLTPGKEYTVFFRAPVQSNKFLLNPDMMADMGIPKNWAYQKEVISVGNIKCDKVIWHINNTKGLFDTDEHDIEQEKERFNKALQML